MKKTRDREILALSLLVKTLRPLDSEARKRAIDYALNRLKAEDEGNMSVREMTEVEKDQSLRNFAGVAQRRIDPEDATLLSPRKVTVVDKATGE